jgi:hypothetical protein
MQERRELQPPIPARCLTYAWSAFPLAALLSSTISAGRSPLFDGFPGTTSASDFSTDRCPGVWLLAFPEPSGVVAPGSAKISQLPCRKLPSVYRVSDRAGLPQDSHLSPWFMLPSALLNGVGVPNFGFRGSMADPPVSPVNASTPLSRATPHDSGPNDSLHLFRVELSSTISCQLGWRTKHHMNTTGEA